MASSAATLAHKVYWDIEFNRPIVDGKIAHPITGEIQQAGRNGLKDGPPSVSLHILNMNAHGEVRSISGVYSVSAEKAYLAVARHVKEGIYKLISVNASAYSFVVVCDVQVSDEEFEAAWINKFAEESEA
jgi:hypothetical protein